MNEICFCCFYFLVCLNWLLARVHPTVLEKERKSVGKGCGIKGGSGVHAALSSCPQSGQRPGRPCGTRLQAQDHDEVLSHKPPPLGLSCGATKKSPRWQHAQFGLRPLRCENLYLESRLKHRPCRRGLRRRPPEDADRLLNQPPPGPGNIPNIVSLTSQASAIEVNSQMLIYWSVCGPTGTQAALRYF